MRTPNTECIICGVPLYRRPFELKKVRYVACKEHREQAKKQFSITEKQRFALSLGREKGTNHLEGMPKSKESNIKRSKSHKIFWAEHPELLKERGKKIRGENHYRWKGGATNFKQGIRRTNEFRKWQKQVKKRDGKCLKCGSVKNLEAHHITHFSKLLNIYKINTINQARECKELWDIRHGKTLCIKCHFYQHGRKFIESKKDNINVKN